MLLTSLKHNMWADVIALAAGAMSWQAVALMVGLQMIWDAVGLFTELQSQRTLVAVVLAIPAGLITIRRDRSGGQVLWLVWVPEPDYERQPRL